jgi:hypothetical protein
MEYFSQQVRSHRIRLDQLTRKRNSPPGSVNPIAYLTNNLCVVDVQLIGCT